MSTIVDGWLVIAGIITAMMMSVFAIREMEPGDVASLSPSAKAWLERKRAA